MVDAASGLRLLWGRLLVETLTEGTTDTDVGALLARTAPKWKLQPYSGLECQPARVLQEAKGLDLVPGPNLRSSALTLSTDVMAPSTDAAMLPETRLRLAGDPPDLLAAYRRHVCELA